MVLSNIELYYCPSPDLQSGNLKIVGEEAFHILKVMRHALGDELFATDGKGSIYKTKINNVSREEVDSLILESFPFQNNFENYIVCIPNLRNNNRLEFALEKSVELGVTKFVLFNSERTISKSFKLERLEKILISAMKQSLRSFLPKILFTGSLEDISKLNSNKIIFEQNSNKYFDNSAINEKAENYFIFGPEGGLSDNELRLFDSENCYKLAENRLRTETAILKLASCL